MARYAIYVCGGPEEPVPDTTSDCPLRGNHTPEPRGYLAWHEWAEGMSRTHLQARCKGCVLLKVWIARPLT